VTVDSIRKILPYTTVLVVLVAVYTAYIFYSRRTDADLISQRQTEKKLEADKDSIARMGGSSLKITSFYANPPVVAKGHAGELCYGVINATSVSLDPPVESVAPSLGRCFPVSPKTSTRFMLRANDEAGKSVEQTVEVAVR
jgi:Ca2+/H+ antiporter